MKERNNYYLKVQKIEGHYRIDLIRSDPKEKERERRKNENYHR
jgi:hypothetical protein